MKVSRSALLPYSAANIFDVIADVRSYPAFLNWCTGMEIVEESDAQTVAKLMIAYRKLNFSFTTRNIMSRDESVNMSLVDGPFSNLEGQWSIRALSEKACKVSLEMEFAFSNVMTQKLFGPLFQTVIVAQLEAFENRANELYGVGRA